MKRADQAAVSRLRTGHLRCMKYNGTEKSYEVCMKCHDKQASPEHILECFSIDKTMLYDKQEEVAELLKATNDMMRIV